MAEQQLAELDNFKASILNDGIEAATSAFLMERVPHVFQGDWDLYRRWKRLLAQRIEVDSLNIVVTGSAGIGFSLNPHKNFRPFSDNSDIDVAVVSDYHFSLAWRALRNIKLPDVRTHREREAIKEHRSKHIYWGVIATDKVLAHLPFVRTWTEALAAMAGEKPTEERDIRIRLYRDYDSLRSYHMNGINSLLSTLMEQ